MGKGLQTNASHPATGKVRQQGLISGVHKRPDENSQVQLLVRKGSHRFDRGRQKIHADFAAAAAGHHRLGIAGRKTRDGRFHHKPGVHHRNLESGRFERRFLPGR